MVNKVFTDENGIQLECYANVDLKCIIKIGESNNFMTQQVIEIIDIGEIEELIKELRMVKKLIQSNKK